MFLYQYLGVMDLVELKYLLYESQYTYTREGNIGWLFWSVLYTSG